MSKFSVGLLFLVIIGQVNAQEPGKEQVSFLGKNAVPVCTDQVKLSCNWSKAAASFNSKRIVLIGEPNHGSKDIFLLRNDLVRYLHEKHGYDVVLFESGMGELIRAEIDKEQLTSEQMSFGLFNGWRTKEFRELMQYIKDKNMSLAGFDCQRTGGSYKSLLASSPSCHDSIFCQSLEDRYGTIQRELTARSVVYDSVWEKTTALINDYDILRGNALLEVIPSTKLFLVLHNITNRIGFLRYMLQFVKDRDFHQRWAARDSLMAANIKWIADNIYKNKKIIVIAHNFHIAKGNETEKVMGNFLSREFGKDMYSIGVFAGSGVFADNGGKETKIVPAVAGQADIKHIIARLPEPVNFFNIPAKKTKGGEWLHEPITVNDTFIDISGRATMTLATHFDGLILVSQSSMPDK